MAIKIIRGNIFNSRCAVLVNTVNCVGVMGAGIALECRLRYPQMFSRYEALCTAGQLQVGKLWLYRGPERWVLNFPTKQHWKQPSRLQYLRAGLDKFRDSWRERQIESIAFPLLGADRGGLSEQDSLAIMQEYLEPLPLPVEIYRYAADVPDDLYTETRDWLRRQEVATVARLSGLRPHYVERVLAAMESPHIVQLNQLAQVDGIGLKTLEAVFRLAQQARTGQFPPAAAQQSLL
ncbi:Appr-1-p processing protein [Microbulbifer flavimaris]|uniref:Appr-1-p processing protein n=1 Tax=Microbulbifer flavimaris TaxID=1781068 RepID=A0ABX4I054_9GAMM|nr:MULTISPECIES: macro domain-containing protein [Microbulbifer]KUJ83437.1 Appr-1-p processing protein [Microbulbifer sp. ZGT114]PCO05593.1 Appr-1-p processing protein [Microbulbifer flavimaris]